MSYLIVEYVMKTVQGVSLQIESSENGILHNFASQFHNEPMTWKRERTSLYLNMLCAVHVSCFIFTSTSTYNTIIYTFMTINPFINRHFTTAARCACEIKYRIAMAKAAFNKKRIFSPANWTLIKRRTSKVPYLEHGFVWC
jgi:hypothetical protein